jgi:hypothetical protein
MISIDYEIPRRGLGTDFSESERPITFAKTFRNRFININGAAERRLGISRFQNTTVPGAPNLTRLHEYTSKLGVDTLLSSTDTGNVYRYSASAWTQTLSGKAASRMISAQAGDKLIFVNGVDRNFYTDDGGQTFNQLKSLISQGQAGSGTNTTTLKDGNITSWLSSTQIALNDVVFNSTVSAFGVVTAVSGADITHTTIGTSGLGAGLAATNQTNGQNYQVIDTVPLNIIPRGLTKDNTAVAGPSTTTTVIQVSGADLSALGLKTGDFIYNTTRNSLMVAQSVSANVNVQATTGQTSGDSLIFIKDAMPIAKWVHVHYGRTYYVDAEDQTKVVISAPDDPQDLATFAKTLDASTFDTGSLQPQGDIIQTIQTFQKYLVMGGLNNLYVYQGIDPVQDTTASSVVFTPVGVYPQGCVSRFSLAHTGNDLLFISPDGLLNASVGSDSNSLVNSNISDVIKNDVREIIAATQPDSIQLSYYPRRNWVMMKIGETIYNFNNTPVSNRSGQLEAGGSWSTFDGTFASMNHYFIRRNGDLLGCATNGSVFSLDSGFTDNGSIIPTDIESAWYRLEEPNRSIRVKDVKYIKPIFESGGGVVYNIEADAGFDGFARDTVSVTAGGSAIVGQAIVGTAVIGGSGVQTTKLPLRVRGEEIKIRITTNTSAGPDVLSGFTLYGNMYGRR